MGPIYSESIISCCFFLNGCHGNNHMTSSKLKLNSYLCSLWFLVQLDSGYSEVKTKMQHQAYQPVLPCVNKYLQYRWDKNCYEMHRNKVKWQIAGLFLAKYHNMECFWLFETPVDTMLFVKVAYNGPTFL